MGDVSIIARRYPDGRVRFGWSGNGGYMRSVGATLLQWYRKPEDVDYLFSLGELRHLGIPGSEHLPERVPTILRTVKEGRPLAETTTERDIFSTIAFVDFAYLYDNDDRWYYIDPGTLVFKIPLELVARHCDEDGSEYAYLRELHIEFNRRTLRSSLSDDSADQNDVDVEEIDALTEELQVYFESGSPDVRPEVLALRQRLREWSERHDPWVVVCPRDEEGREVDFITRPRMGAERQETRDWCEVREIAWPVSEPVPREDLCFVSDKRVKELYEAMPGMTPEDVDALDPIDLMRVSAIATLYFIRANALLPGFYSEDDDKALAQIRIELFCTELRTWGCT